MHSNPASCDHRATIDYKPSGRYYLQLCQVTFCLYESVSVLRVPFLRERQNFHYARQRKIPEGSIGYMGNKITTSLVLRNCTQFNRLQSSSDRNVWNMRHLGRFYAGEPRANELRQSLFPQKSTAAHRVTRNSLPHLLTDLPLLSKPLCRSSELLSAKSLKTYLTNWEQKSAELYGFFFASGTSGKGKVD